MNSFADRSVATLALIISAIAGGWILWLGKSLLLPLILAIFVWHLVDAMARGFLKLLPGRVVPYVSSKEGMPSATVHFALLTLLFSSFSLAAGGFAELVEQVKQKIPLYTENIKPMIFDTLKSTGMEERLPDLDKITEAINFAEITGNLLGVATSIIGSSFAVLLYVVFLILEQHSFAGKLHALCGDGQRADVVNRMLQQIGNSIRTYVWLKSSLAIATGVCSYVVLLVIGIDFPVFWGVIIFALTYVPYVGALLSVLLPALLALPQFGQWQEVIQAIIALGFVQVVLGQIVEPKLFGKSLNISPLAVLFSLAFWGALWGGMGMFLSVPITVVVMIVCAHITRLRPVAIVLSADGIIPEAATAKAQTD